MLRFVELYLEEETAFESLVQILGQVGGGYQDTVQILYLLKDDVLHGIVHFVHRMLDVLRTLVDDGISFVEEEDRHDFRLFANFTIVVEDGLDVFFAFAHPFVTQTGNVHLHDVSTGLTGYL